MSFRGATDLGLARDRQYKCQKSACADFWCEAEASPESSKPPPSITGFRALGLLRRPRPGKHKGTLYSFATILPCGGPAFVKETERAIRQLGLKGILIHSSHKGHYPDDDEARPFWELVAELDVPVMIHPPHLGFGEERMREYRLASSIGRPFDLCLALGRLIVRGILEDFPSLKIVASHGGGGICETISRMDYAYELQEEAFFLGPYAPMKIKHPPSYYLKKMHLDTVTYNPPAVKMVLEWMGSDRVLYGSDAPPLTSLKPRAIQLINDLEIADSERERIFWRNAARLLKLPIAGTDAPH